MAANAVLNHWPNITNCVVCSHDCELAIAADEHVQLMIPKLKPARENEEVGTDLLWTPLTLRINYFLDEELKMQEPLSSATFSIGEEQSQAHVVQLSWSCPGLAKYGRSVLGVLTSNLVLSVWASQGQPHLLDDWKRVLIINHTLEEHFKGSSVPDKPSLRKQLELLQPKRRIRSFAWAPQTDAHLLAVGTDDDTVLVFRVTSPHSREGSLPTQWAAHIVLSFPTAPQTSPKPDLSWTFEDYIRQRRFVAHLAWSPWKDLQDNFHSSVLAIATCDRLELREVRFQDGVVHMSVSAPIIEQTYDPFLEAITGPLQWFPKITTEGKMHLSAATSQKVVSFDLLAATEQPPIVVDTLNTSREEWDQVSALVFTDAGASKYCLETTNILTSRQKRSARRPITMQEETMSPPTAWQERLEEQSDAFSKKHSLEKNLHCKVWGMATSPLGNWTSTCSTYHPSDVPEYRIAAEHQCNLNVDSTQPDSGGNFFLPANGGISRASEITPELLAFELKKYISDNSENIDNEFLAGTAYEQMRSACGISDSSRNGPKTQNDVSMSEVLEGCLPEDLINWLRRQTSDPTEMKDKRLRYLVTQCTPGSSPLLESEKELVECVVRNVLHLPQPALVRAQKDVTVWRIYQRIAKFLTTSMVEDSSTPDGQAIEVCDVCDAPIPFESVGMARCATGHIFGRCGLTFCAIQAPGLTKSCSICEKQFLLHKFFQTESGQSGTTQEDSNDVVENGSGPNDDRNSLSTLLLTAFDKCIYCGAKFID